MPAEQEAVNAIYNDAGELIAIVKRDDKSKKHLVYLVKEAVSEDIIGLIKK